MFWVDNYEFAGDTPNYGELPYMMVGIHFINLPARFRLKSTLSDKLIPTC